VPYYWEDFEQGQVFELGSRSLSEDEMIAFARDWDPQFFHIDPKAAQDGPFGGLVASGWQTAALWGRMFVDGVLSQAESMGGDGITDLRFFEPTRPGMRLHGRITVVETKASSKRPDVGTVIGDAQLTSDAGTTVMRLRIRVYFRRRP